MDRKRQKGFTLIELIMTMTILLIISVAGVYFFYNLIQHTIYIPNQLNMNMVASRAMDIMIEGDENAKGLRFSKQITDISANQISFNSQDDTLGLIVYRLDTPTHKLYRSVGNVNGGAESLIPYFVTAGIDIYGKTNVLFTFYDVNNALTAVPDNVRRIDISIIAQNGSGSFSNWEGYSELNSSIAVKKF